jgi:hypothetical protein
VNWSLTSNDYPEHGTTCVGYWSDFGVYTLCQAFADLDGDVYFYAPGTVTALPMPDYYLQLAKP